MKLIRTTEVTVYSTWHLNAPHGTIILTAHVTPCLQCPKKFEHTTPSSFKKKSQMMKFLL